jgi:hypothetical protein
LAVLPRPGHLGKRTHLEEHNVHTYELSGKLYAVRDAFESIVRVVSDFRNSEIDGTDHPSRLPSLGVMCAVIIGKHVQSDYDPGMQPMKGEELAETVNEVYDSIPSHCLPCVLHLHF